MLFSITMTEFLIRKVFNKVFLFIAICFFTASATLAQESRVNAIEAQFQALKRKGVNESDTSWISLLNVYAGANNSSNPDTSLKVALKALELAQKVNFTEGVIEANRQIGFAYSIIGDEVQSLKFVNHAVELALQHNQLYLLSKAYNSLAIIFKNQTKYANALENYLKSLKIKIQLGDLRGQANTYGNIGILFKNLDDHAQAAWYYEKTHKLFKKLNDSVGISSSLGNLGIMYLEMKDYQAADSVLKEAIRWKKAIGDWRGLSYDLNHLGSMYLEMGRMDEALPYLQQSLVLKVKLNEPIPTAVSYLDLSDYHFQKNNLDSAFYYAFQAVSQLKFTENLAIRKKLNQQLSKLYGQKGDHKKAYNHLALAQKLDDSLRHEILGKKMSLMEIKLKEQFMKEREREMEDIHLSKLNKQKYWLSAIGAIVFLLAIVTFYLFRERLKLSQSNWQLKQAHAEISRQHREIELKSEELARFNTALVQQKEEISFLNQYLQNKIEERTQSLEKQNASLKNYAFSVSHSLRKHAANIIGLTDLLNQAKNGSQEYQEILHHLTISSYNLDETIREMNNQLQSGLLDYPNEELPGDSGLS